jgi:predicted DNA-binding antitoxin AbrB/MazE fold protein
MSTVHALVAACTAAAIKAALPLAKVALREGARVAYQAVYLRLKNRKEVKAAEELAHFEELMREYEKAKAGQ